MAKRRDALESLPWRGARDQRPGLRLPPESMPMRNAGVWRKRWRYVAGFGESVMLCAANVHVGPFGQTFWAVLDRSSGEILESTRRLLPAERGEVWTERGGGYEPWALGETAEVAGLRTRIESHEAASAKLTFGEASAWAEVICPAEGRRDGGYVWTRKRTSRIELDLKLADGRHLRESLRGIEDESAGYHPRHTVWSWSAGVGETSDGLDVAWNLVEGVNDPPAASERAIWLAGEDEPREPGPVSFDGLEAIAFDDGSRLDFSAEAERSHEENRVIVRSSYRQPFGTFSGSLPGLELDSGLGVMEHHDAVW